MSNFRNRKYKFIIAAIMAATMLISMTGCQSKGITAQPGADNNSANTSESGHVLSSSDTSDSTGGNSAKTEHKFPREVTDGNGFTMTIESEPQRIVSLTLGSDEILIGMVDKSRIASLTQYADDEGISNIASEASGVGERITTDQVEKLIALNPDLVILDTWADAKYVKQLRDAGIKVYAFKTPCNIDEQKAVILELANVAGADEEGKKLVEWMDAKLKAVEEKLSGLKPEQKLTVMDYGEIGSSGAGTNFDDIVTKAGLINVISRAGIEGWPVISKEKMIEFNPDIIILPSWFYDQKNSFEGMRDTLKNDQSLKTVKAISEDRIISVPNPHVSAISQYVVLAVEDIAKAAYPELFE